MRLSDLETAAQAKPFDLAAVKARNLPRLTFDGLFKSSDMADADRQVVSDYLSRFVMLDKYACPGCGKTLTGGLIEQFLGVATFTWGLVHGEGYCRGCRYPARAYHFDVGPIERFVAVLAWHPDELVSAVRVSDEST